MRPTATTPSVRSRSFARDYGVKWPKAVAKITDDAEELLCFFDFPAEHWLHLKTSNPIESTFSSVRLRTRVTKGPGSKAAGLAMAFKLLEAAQDRWRAVNGPHLVALVRAGARFDKGVMVERPDEVAGGRRVIIQDRRSTTLDDSSTECRPNLSCLTLLERSERKIGSYLLNSGVRSMPWRSKADAGDRTVFGRSWYRPRHREVVGSETHSGHSGVARPAEGVVVFVQMIQGQVTDAGKVRAALDRWAQELATGATGWLGSTAGVTEDGRFIALARFESEQAPAATATDPSRTGGGPRRPSCSPGRPASRTAATSPWT